MTQETKPDVEPAEADTEFVIEDDAEEESNVGVAPEPGTGVILPDGTQLGIDAGQQARIDLLFDGLDQATYYEILQISKEAPNRAIKRAYYKLSREFHPDRFFRRELGPYKPKLEQGFAKINEAYRVLSDASARADYDARSFQEELGPSGQMSMATH